MNTQATTHAETAAATVKRTRPTCDCGAEGEWRDGFTGTGSRSFCCERCHDARRYGNNPVSPCCNARTNYYRGLLGYESFRCDRCGQDIADIYRRQNLERACALYNRLTDPAKHETDAQYKSSRKAARRVRFYLRRNFAEGGEYTENDNGELHPTRRAI